MTWGCNSALSSQVVSLVGEISPKFRWSGYPWIPSGKLTVCYSKWPLIVDLPVNNGDVPWFFVCLPVPHGTMIDEPPVNAGFRLVFQKEKPLDSGCSSPPCETDWKIIGFLAMEWLVRDEIPYSCWLEINHCRWKVFKFASCPLFCWILHQILYMFDCQITTVWCLHSHLSESMSTNRQPEKCRWLTLW